MITLLLILSFLSAHVCHGQVCFTNDEGPVKNSTCVFPFIVGGQTYTECTNDTDSEGKLWCSTEVDQEGNYIKGLWGYCNSEVCETEPETEKNPTPIKEEYQCGTKEDSNMTLAAGPTNDDEVDPVGFWPWMASFGYLDDDEEWVHQCGATLISQEHFLTAAHCLSGQKDWKVKTGNPNITSKEVVQICDVLSWDIHEYYHQSLAYFDVAVLWVQPVNISQDIRHICLPSEPCSNASTYDYRMAQLIEWEKSDIDGKTSYSLRRVAMKIFPQRECYQSYSETSPSVMKIVQGVLPDLFQNHIICAGSRIGEQGSCQDDSGVPLMIVTEGGTWTLVAIARGSIGGCEDPKLPSLFIRLDDPSILNFIKTSMALVEEDGGDQLLRAASSGHLNAVKYLVNKDANIEAAGFGGRTPLMYAIEKGHLGVVKYLLEKGANVETREKHYRTPLIFAARYGHLDIVEYLLDKCAAIEGREKYGKNSLMYAIENGHLDVAKFLLDKGADVESKDENGKTPLMFAARHGNLNAVKYLLDKGADIDAKDTDGWNPLIFSGLNRYLDTVKYLLDKGANIEAKENYGRTPLIIAAEKGHLSVVELLLGNGANIEAKDIDEWTALIYSAANDQLDTLKYLVDKGANIEAASSSGLSPLIYATLKGHLDVVKHLLDNGANIKAKSNDGKSVLAFAANSDIKAYLESRGATM